MSLTNVSINGEPVDMNDHFWEIGSRVTFHDSDGPNGFAIIEKNPGWNVCHNYLRSRQDFQRPLEVVAEMRAEGKEETADGFAMSLFSNHVKANSGYCFMSHGAMLEIGVDNFEDQSQHFVTRMNPTFTICEAMTHYMGHSSFFFGYRDGGLILHSSPGKGFKGDKAFKDDGHTLQFAYNGLNDGRWHHVATVYDANKKHAALFVDGELVETHKYTEAVAPRLVEVGIGAPASNGPAAFCSTIQLAEPRRDDGGLERPWLHAHVAVRNYIFPGGDADRRDDEESFYISVHDREVNQSQWCLIPAGEENVYYIRLVTHDEWNPWNRTTCWSDTWKAFPYLTAVEEYEYDYRENSSTRVFVTREPRGDSSRWRLVPSEEGDDLFHIQLVGTRGVNLPGGACLYAYEDEDDDIRDEFSSYPCVHDNAKSLWRVHQGGGQLHHREFSNPSPLQGQQPFPEGAEGGLRNTAMYARAMNSKDVLRLFNTNKGEFKNLSKKDAEFA